ncbi:MAG: Gfo/Idh/MocA family oxidoreductase [Sphaerochaeta sp.]|nr:Gfo/Idh/MocA family oxidoreductase [Sphaerochaeta sp.]
MESVRYGIVGFGGIAENRIAKEGFALGSQPSSENSRLAQLVCASDKNPAREAAARALGLEWYADSDSLLADSSIEAVVIATNNRTHAAIARAALETGKHVFLEKPAGVTLDEVTSLVALARSKRLSLGIDHMMTKNSYNQMVKGVLKDKKIGKIQHMVLHMEFPFGMDPSEATTWRCSDPGELGGPIGDVGSHCLYMAEFLTDDTISCLQCLYTPKHLATAVEDGAIIHITLASGGTGTIRVAFDQPRGSLSSTIRNLGYEVYGTEGTLYTYGTLFQLSGHAWEPVKIQVFSDVNGKIEELVPESIQNIYESQLYEHALSIRTGDLLDGDLALHNLSMILLAHESALTGGQPMNVEILK